MAINSDLTTKLELMKVDPIGKFIVTIRVILKLLIISIDICLITSTTFAQ
jgi:hypothetical protein